MSRNRFELLLSNFHFADNIFIVCDNRLRKIAKKVSKNIHENREYIVIDETLIPQQRFIFKRYISNKTHKSNYFNYGQGIYMDNENLFSAGNIRETELVHKICLQLTEKLFYQEQILYIDNFHLKYELFTSCLKDSYSWDIKK